MKKQDGQTSAKRRKFLKAAGGAAMGLAAGWEKPRAGAHGTRIIATPCRPLNGDFGGPASSRATLLALGS